MLFTRFQIPFFASIVASLSSIGLGLAILYSDLRVRDSVLTPSLRTAHWSLNEQVWPHASFWLVVAVPPLLLLLLLVFEQLALHPCCCCVCFGCPIHSSSDKYDGRDREAEAETDDNGEGEGATAVQTGGDLQMTQFGPYSHQLPGSSFASAHRYPPFNSRPRPTSFLY